MDDLLVFGYSCKLFKNDDKALELDQGKNLCPWMGDENLLIDRFDCRGYLQDIKPYEVSKSLNQIVTKAEEQIESQCDAERFADLNEDPHEEEIEKLRHALLAEGAYSQLPYNYDGNDQDQPSEISPPSAEVEEAFIAPPGLEIPSSMKTPVGMKEHGLIEKTASFIAQNGLQMEIVIKAKQAQNSNFTFLTYGSELNPYYKHLLGAIKAGTYSPSVRPKEEDNSSDSENSDSDDGGYLHPSLMAKKTVQHPAVAVSGKSSTENNAYSQLIQSLKEKIPQEIETNSAKPLLLGGQSEAEVLTSCDSNKQKKWPLLPQPSPEIQQIIDKLASYVSKNGNEFEMSIKKRNDERFDFLSPGHMFHSHYIKKKLFYLDQRREEAASLLQKQNETAESKKVLFSFSVKDKKSVDTKGNGSKSLRPSDGKEMKDNTELADRLANAAKEGLSRDHKKLQEERKRRAALFLSLITAKQESKEESSASGDTFYGPALPVITVPENFAKREKESQAPPAEEREKRKLVKPIVPFIRPDYRPGSKRSRSRSPEARSSSSKHNSKHRYRK
ncbi:Protein suppressor of white apricot [Halotydeus destructor]|nr:Protein suppressor of white apricot [Halotydeus destructor]